MYAFADEARARVSVEARTLTSDNLGGQGATWSALCTVWAVVTPQGSSVDILSGVLPRETLSAEIWVRYRADVAAKGADSLRLSYKGRSGRVEGIAAFDENRTHIGTAFLRLSVVFDAPNRGENT